MFDIDRVQENHFILRYRDHHQILAIHPLLINSKEIDASLGFVKISHMDEITICGKIFRFLSAEGDDSDLESTQSQKIGVYNPEAASKIPQFIKDAILEKHNNLLEAARRQYI